MTTYAKAGQKLRCREGHLLATFLKDVEIGEYPRIGDNIDFTDNCSKDGRTCVAPVISGAVVCNVSILKPVVTDD